MKKVVAVTAARLFLAAALVALLASAAGANALGIPDTEYQALVALYNSTNGPNWTYQDNWLTTSAPWYGVTVTSGHVTMLDLSFNQLSGTIPPELGNLTNLQTLELGYNQLSGTIPTEVGNLTSLTGLYLGDNQLSGTIPSQIGNLTDLQGLDLSDNQLSGTIPSWIGNLANLTGLDLYNNQLSGTIPPQIGNLTNLQTLVLLRNQLGGTIPSELGNLTNLTWLDLGGNQLSGTIPPELGNLANLQWLDLSYNQLSGTIPSWIGNLANLTWLCLDHNQLSGTIPSELGNLTNLQCLHLYNNQLSGTIPSQIGNLTNLQTLLLNNNQLSGTIPSQISNLTSLQWLYLSYNQLSGTIPSQIGNLTNLTVLWLMDNQLSGTIPSELGSLTNLQWLELGWNQLSGTIPPELGNLTNLQELDLSSNQIVGDIPPSIVNLNKLVSGQYSQYTSVSHDGLSSADPAVVAFMAANFPGWQDTQTVPPTNVSASPSTPGTWVVSWTPIAYIGDDGYYEVGVSQTSGGPYTFSAQNRTASKSATRTTVTELMPGANYLVVRTVTPANSNNQNTVTSLLSTEAAPASNPLGIPDTEYQALVALYNSTNGPNWTYQDNWLTTSAPWYGVTVTSGHVTMLDLSFNQLSGTIPPDLGNLTNLQYLYLYSNELSGAIPPELGNLANLQDLYLGWNRLSGPIPPELGNLTNLQWLNLSSNQIVGDIPSSIGNLGNLVPFYGNISYNGLWCTDPAVSAKFSGWQDTQTVPPMNVSASPYAPGPCVVSWTPIAYGGDGGYYEVGISQTPGGPYTFTAQNRTASKSASHLTVTGLGAGVNYLVMRTVTPANSHNQNTVTSLLSTEVVPASNPFGIPDMEYQALLALYNSTNGPKWTHHDNWLTNSTPWYGVTVTSGHVTSLVLCSNQLSGTIPPELGNLTNLQSLYLYNNQLSGTMPPDLGNLTNLKELVLGFNQLSGAMPPELGNLKNLQYLDLFVNHLSGAIPPELGNLTNLQRLVLGFNQLSGRIPPELGNLTNLQWLVLGLNQLSGTMPPELGNLTNLQWLDLSSNQFIGVIPPSIVNLSKLVSGSCSVSYNGVWSTDAAVLSFMAAESPGWQNTQTVPPTNVSVMALFGLGKAALIRWTPIAYTGDGGYYEVGISQTSGGPYTFSTQNRVSSKCARGRMITVGLVKGTNYLVVRTVTPANSHNQNTITSPLSEQVAVSVDPLGIPDAEYQALGALYSSSSGPNWTNHTNWLTDTAPWYGVTVTAGQVTSLNLPGNQLSGTIPSQIGNLTNLEHLDLSSNQIVGDLPPSIVNLSKVVPGYTSVSYNGVSSTDAAVLTFMAAKIPGWQDTQTVPPTNFSLLGFGSGSAIVCWTPIAYTGDGGYYEVGISQTSGGPYTFSAQNRTASKSAAQLTVTGMVSGVNYFVVRTVTPANVNNQNTVTSLLSPEVAAVAGLNKSYADGISGEVEGIVTASFTGFFYVENEDRSCAIRVVWSGPTPGSGKVDVTGVLRTNPGGERYIEASGVTPVGSGTVAPLGLANKLLGGGDWRYDPATGAGQCGVWGEKTMNNIGLLVRIWGRVTLAGRGWFYLDDGSGVSDGSGIRGVYVDAEGRSVPSVGAYVCVTGISSCDRYLGRVVNTLLATGIIEAPH